MRRDGSALARAWTAERFQGLGNSRLALALLVFAGYYVGARIGLALTFPPNPISVLWPPNAILFAALLIAPRDRTWIVIAAALPAHLLAELQSQVPPTMVMCWFVSNITEALIGSAGTRWLMRGAIPFDSLRGTVAFLAASFVAVFLSSFLDSALIVLNRWSDPSFWQLWETRLFANVATAWTLVPLIVSWALQGDRFVREATLTRVAEAAALVLLILVIAFLVPQSADASSGSLRFLFLPLFLWAALRFGLIGASTAFALVAFCVIWQTGHAATPSGSGSPSDDARAVHLFIMVVAPALLCLVAVLSERRRVEDLLRAGERRFRLVLEATRDTIFDRDVRTGELLWDANGLAQFGYDTVTRPDRIEDWRALIHPEDVASVKHASDDAIHGTAERLDCEFRLRRRDGTYAHVRARSFIVRETDGAPLRVIGSLSDVSERYEIEQMSATLAHAARLASVGELAATITHEINQPMSAILSNVDAAEMLIEGDGARAAELRDILNDIRNDDLRASEVIRHIRGFSHKQPAQIASFAIDEVIADALRIVSRTASLRQVQVGTDLAALPPVRGDRIYVQQVLLNLLLNGMDAMASSSAVRTLVVATTLGQGDEVEVAVTDSGPGIPPADIERIFESFFTTKPDGMGLGLRIARSLTTANGGRIWAENAAAGGATFRFTLPLARAADRRTTYRGSPA